jgi:D-alanyl-D-alanine dipeptidase
MLHPPSGPSQRMGMQGAPEPIAALNRVHILEVARPWNEREPLVDVRTYCPHFFFGDRICPFLRLRVADMLNHAHNSLPTDRRLRIATALRTLSMQKGGWDNYFKRMREEHPAWPLSSLRRATNKYHAPYDQKAPPGHCTGGAVDVILVDLDNQPIDVTAPTQGWDAAYTWSDKLAPEARANRMVMVEGMLAAGFSNCRDEYWHYSFGDSAWAVRVGEYECPYGWAHPPVCLETDFTQAVALEPRIETVRDFNGRALRAEGSCAVPTGGAPTQGGQPSWCVGLYWAREIPVTMRLAWPSPPDMVELYAGPALESLEPIPNLERDGDTVVIHITPATDRVLLSNFPAVPAA